MTNRRAAAIFAASVVCVLSATGRTSAHDPTTKVTYSREIVRLLDQHCVGCHRPGGSAPMPFTTYAEARPWAHAMKEMVFEHQMPPWPAAPGFGDFENDPTLTPFAAELLGAWADGGAPNGNEGDMPSAAVRLKSDPTFQAYGPPAFDRDEQHLTFACGRTTLDRDIRAIAVKPHAASGEVSARAQTSDGAVRPLIVIPAFDLRYQLTYRFRRPLDLPKGTVIDARGPASGCEIDLAIVIASRQP